MGILDLLGPILKVAGKVLGIGDKVKEVADAIEGAPPEVRAKIAADLQQHEQALKALSIEEMRVAMSESIAMVQSSDKYVSRARPTGLYIFYLVSAAIAVGMLFGVRIDSTAVLTILGPLAGVGGTYVYNRTREKLNGNGHGD